MYGVVKIAALSAALAAALVTATERDGPATAAKPEAALEVIIERPLEPVPAIDGRCGAGAWPYIEEGCVHLGVAPARKAVRAIVVDRREATGPHRLTMASR